MKLNLALVMVISGEGLTESLGVSGSPVGAYCVESFREEPLILLPTLIHETFTPALCNWFQLRFYQNIYHGAFLLPRSLLQICHWRHSSVWGLESKSRRFHLMMSIQRTGIVFFVGICRLLSLDVGDRKSHTTSSSFSW